MGFFKKSHLHVDSCRFFVRPVCLKRKREEEPKEKAAKLAKFNKDLNKIVADF